MSKAGTAMYKSTSLAASLLGSMIATKIFNLLWRSARHDETPPSAAALDQRMRDVLVTAMLHGAVIGVTRAVLERGNARSFGRLSDEPG